MRTRTYWMIILALLAALMGQCAGTANPAPEISTVPVASQVDDHGCGSEDSR
jgi:hypothetical protein